MTWEEVASLVSFISNATSSLASLIAVYLFLFKRKAIVSAFSVLLNYSQQLTLSEIKEKLELLNNFNASEPAHADTISNIFHELLGQMRGNDKLTILMSVQIKKLELLFDFDNEVSVRQISEAKKRALISEIREKVRHLNVRNVDELAGSKS